jgi:hypothetical protein
VKLARLTRGKESSSWRTPTEAETHNQDYSSQTYLQNQVQPNWPTVCASEVRQGFQDRSRGMKGSQESLTTAVVKDWPTIRVKQAEDCPSERMRRSPSLDSMAKLHGQAAPVSSSSLGSRQGLWLTPRANEPDSDPNFAARNADRGAHCHGTLSSQAKAEQWATPSTADTNRMWKPETLERRKAEGKVAQMGLNYQAVKLWPTITAHTPDMESNGPNGHQGTYLAGAVKQWATPAAFDWNTAENKAAWEKRAAEQKSKGVNLHLPLKSQAIHEAEKQWAAPKTPTGGPETAKRKQELGRTASGGGDLASQANGKLNPRWVETLMGLPIGWTMPSCTSPQTIAPMSCDSSATELCLPPQSEPSEFSLAS